MFFVGENCGQKEHKSFSGKFGEIREKIFRTTKNLPAPTPMNCYIENFAADSEKNLLDLAANQLKWQYSP